MFTGVLCKGPRVSSFVSVTHDVTLHEVALVRPEHPQTTCKPASVACSSKILSWTPELTFHILFMGHKIVFFEIFSTIEKCKYHS